MRILRIKSPLITSYNIEKVSGRGNFQKALNNKGITDWNYSRGSNELMVWVNDDFDISKISEFGTVEVIGDDT